MNLDFSQLTGLVVYLPISYQYDHYSMAFSCTDRRQQMRFYDFQLNYYTFDTSLADWTGTGCATIHLGF